MKNLDTLKDVFKHLDDPVYIVDKNRNILFFNKAAEKLTGFKEDELKNTRCFNNILNHINDKGVQLCLGYCPLVESLETNKVVTSDVYLHHKDGHRLPVHIKTIPYISDGETIGAIEIFNSNYKRDINFETDFIKNNLSMIDPLTGLLNRNFLKFKIPKIVRDSSTPYFLLFLDLDDFKSVNDTFGHIIGDEVLKAVSKTLLSNTKSKDYIIRFGGEEFLVFLQEKNIDEAYKTAEKLRLLISNSSIRKIKYSPKASIGLTKINSNKTLNQNINIADKAMYEAKNNGKNRTVIKE